MKPIETGSLEEKYASGPFKLQSYSPGRQIVLVFNKNYDQSLGVRGHVAKIVFSIGVQSTQASEQIQAGQLDFQTSNLATADILQDLARTRRCRRQVHTLGAAVDHLHLPQQPGAAAQQRRRAQGHQLRDQPDRRYCQQWGGPLAGTPVDNIIPAGQSDYKQFSLYPNTPNLTEAKKLMAASGVKTPVTLVLRTQNDAPGFMNMAAGHPGQPQGRSGSTSRSSARRTA